MYLRSKGGAVLLLLLFPECRFGEEGADAGAMNATFLGCGCSALSPLYFEAVVGGLAVVDVIVEKALRGTSPLMLEVATDSASSKMGGRGRDCGTISGRGFREDWLIEERGRCGAEEDGGHAGNGGRVGRLLLLM